MTTHTAWIPSASSGGRTVACPGWSALTYYYRDMLVQTSSDYADDGTAAHRMLELRQLGKPVKSKKDKALKKRLDKTDDKERHWRAIDFAEHAIKRRLKAFKSETVWTEGRVSIFDFAVAPYTGTIDLAAISLIRKRVLVVDYKHGAGVPVTAIDNMQLVAYLFGAFCRAIDGGEIAQAEQKDYTFTGVIIQPRCIAVDPEQAVSYTYAELMVSVARLRSALEFAAMLRINAAEHNQPPPIETLKKGTHCQFCPARIFCPHHQKKMRQAIDRYIVDTTDRGFTRLQQKDLERMHLDAMGIKRYLEKLNEYLAARLATGNGAGLVKVVPGSNRQQVRPDARRVLQNAKDKGEITGKQFRQCLSQTVVPLADLRHNLPPDVYKRMVGSMRTRPRIVDAKDERPDNRAVTLSRFRAEPIDTSKIKKETKRNGKKRQKSKSK